MERLLIKFVGPLFALSLFAPAFVYEPTPEGNPKYSVCAYAMEPDVQCSEFPFDSGFSSECGTQGITNPIDKNKIIEYCKGFDTPMSRKVLGYEALLSGWLGVFLFNFAWFANLALLLAFISIKKKNFLRARKFAIIAVLLALNSFLLKKVPANEGGTREDIVAHLGLGFALWLSAILCTLAYAWKMQRKTSQA